MRVASSLHFEAARANAAEADRRLGVHTQKTPGRAYGMEIPRPAPPHDYAADTTWAWAVDKHMELIAAAALATERADYGTREARALLDAE